MLTSVMCVIGANSFGLIYGRSGSGKTTLLQASFFHKKVRILIPKCPRSRKTCIWATYFHFESIVWKLTLSKDHSFFKLFFKSVEDLNAIEIELSKHTNWVPLDAKTHLVLRSSMSHMKIFIVSLSHKLLYWWKRQTNRYRKSHFRT